MYQKFIKTVLRCTVPALAFVFVACTGDGYDDNSMRISASLSGAAERPNPVVTPATGTITGTYFNITNQLTFTLSWTGLSAAPIAMHYHGPAGPDQTAPPVVGITGFPAGSSATMTQTITLTNEQEQQLMNGQWYFNIHTPANPPGEIRGQVLVSK